MSKYPNLAKLTANFIKASAKIVASGFEVVSEEDYQNRLNTCNACDRLDRKDKRCTNCGCWVEKKAAFAAEHCPLKKW